MQTNEYKQADLDLVSMHSARSSTEPQETRQKNMIALLLKRRGIKAEFEPVRNKLIVEITNTNKDPSEFYQKMMFVSNKNHTNKLILVDNELAIESFPREFLFGPHTTSVAMYLGAFNSAIPAFRKVTKKIDLNLPELQTALPSLPESVQIFRLNSRKYNVPLEKFPEGLRVLHLRLKKYDEAIPVYPANLEELTLELQSYRQEYPVLPAGLRKFHLRNMQEAGKRLNFNYAGNLMDATVLENFGEMVTYFPEGLDEVELPDNYRYPLPEVFLERIVDGTIKRVRIYGTKNRDTIVILSKEKLERLIKEISVDEKKIFETTGKYNKDIFIKYKTIFEMYKNIEVDINTYIIKFTNEINTKYIDYILFDKILSFNLFFDYESFNMNLPDFQNVQSLRINSKAFNQQIPQLNSLTELRIISEVFNQPIPQLDSLRFLHIKSEAFNQQIPQLNSLDQLVITSVVFNQQIPQLNSLNDLGIESAAFNHPIPEFNLLRSLTIKSAAFNQPIPQLYLLGSLTIESAAFNHPIPQLYSLFTLGIISEVFNHPIRQLNSLVSLTIESAAFNQRIPILNKIEKIMIVSSIFNQPIPAELSELKKLYIVSPQFSQRIPEFNQSVELYIRAYTDNLEELYNKFI